MPRHAAEPHDASHVEDLLHQRGATHLRARKYGSAVLVESGPINDPIKHFRLRRETVHLWWLDIADHRDRWERTPLRASLDDLVQAVVDDFPWTISPNPE